MAKAKEAVTAKAEGGGPATAAETAADAATTAELVEAAQKEVQEVSKAVQLSCMGGAARRWQAPAHTLPCWAFSPTASRGWPDALQLGRQPAHTKANTIADLRG